MPNPMVALIGSSLGGVAQAAIGAGAAKNAARGQAAAAERARQLVMPWVTAGTGATTQMQAMLGLSGNEAQAKALQGIEQSPEFASLMQQGENAILQNASATGGLRGGNTQAALAQFRPGVLNSLVQQRYGQLQGMSAMGQNAAVQAGTNIQQAGAAIAGGQMAGAAAFGQGLNSLTQGVGTYFGSFGGQTPSPYQIPQGETLFGSWGGGF